MSRPQASAGRARPAPVHAALLLAATAAAATVTACGTGSDTPAASDGQGAAGAGAYPRDGAGDGLTAGPDQVLWEVPAFELAPGTELQNCYALPPTDTELLVTRYDTQQAPGGHHLAFYRALTDDRPVGEWQDCSSPESHATLVPLLAALNAPGDGTAYVSFPEGMALRIPAGTRLVAQAHYINVTDDPLLTSDQALLTLVPEPERASVTRLYTAPLARVDFALEPGKQTRVDFGCEVPQALELVLMVPHMHDHGRKFELQMGPADAMRSVIDVPEWEPDMRDRPPLTDFTTGAQSGRLEAGDRIEVACTWFNDTDQVLRFPQEMCAGFGYFHADDPSFDTFSCVQ